MSVQQKRPSELAQEDFDSCRTLKNLLDKRRELEEAAAWPLLGLPKFSWDGYNLGSWNEDERLEMPVEEFSQELSKIRKTLKAAEERLEGFVKLVSKNFGTRWNERPASRQDGLRSGLGFGSVELVEGVDFDEKSGARLSSKSIHEISASSKRFNFRPERLIIPSDIAYDVTIESIKIGEVEQLAGGGIPGSAFSDVVDAMISFDTVSAGTTVTLHVKNTLCGKILFRASMFGEIWEVG